MRATFARSFQNALLDQSSNQASLTLDAPVLNAASGLRSAVDRLLELQGSDGAWEAELVWCPMLTAQYVLVHHIVGRPINDDRRRRLLRYFERTRDAEGLWGFHERADPHLFITTIVFVAARLLGVDADDPLIRRAYHFIRTAGVTNIPSWGKFWLALLNLYDWRGVNPILPELWSLPRWLPIHPSNWYCHSRLIYMAMAFIYSRRYSTPMTPTIATLRDELYSENFDEINFALSRGRLRKGDLYVPPTAWLRMAYKILNVFERFHSVRLRKRCLTELLRQIRWELKGTSHASLSPLNGLLNIVALWLHDVNSEEMDELFEQLERWVWNDEPDGVRVAIQRTATWDTGFAQQALATVPDLAGVSSAQQKATSYLMQEQIQSAFDGFEAAHRIDPRGGWCLGRSWQGWPVSDCTAEAVLGILACRRESPDVVDVIEQAVGFMLRGQNRDGGFGSYEARRTQIPIEWLNPSEMFVDAMSEDSYVECTVSCLVALANCYREFPQLQRSNVKRAITRGERWLRQNQGSDGSWRGNWGINFIYGTMFGIRGLVIASADRDDQALRLACRWLLDRQRSDGGWGEHHSGCLVGQYVPHEESQIVQTAWALMALLEAEDSDWHAITRGVAYLLDHQEAVGSWPKQDPAGVYARSGVLDYPLYRQYFPLHALGLYEHRRSARLREA